MRLPALCLPRRNESRVPERLDWIALDKGENGGECAEEKTANHGEVEEVSPPEGFWAYESEEEEGDRDFTEGEAHYGKGLRYPVEPGGGHGFCLWRSEVR